jgi:hypothetical protein
MPRLPTRWFLLPALLAGAVPAVWVAHTSRRGPAALPPDDWDIPRLVAHLKEKGLDLRAVPTTRDGELEYNAYLTTTNARWLDLNGLMKDPQLIGRWRGTVYCERRHNRSAVVTLHQLWGDCYFLAGPFLFFGDRQLLEQIRAALTSPS